MRRTVNVASHIPEELKTFEDDFEWQGDYIIIYVPRVIYSGDDEELRGKTERLLPDFLEPYHHYPVEDIQSALDPDVKKPQTTADERTIARWRKTWKAIMSEIKRKAGEKERIGIKINKLPDGIEAATREIRDRLKGRWFSACYVMAFLTKPSRRTNLEHPPSFSVEVLLCEVTSKHEEKTEGQGADEARNGRLQT